MAPARGGDDDPPRVSKAARVAAAGALALALVVVALVVLNGGSSYSLSADFQNASGLVTGDNVLIGPAAVGTVKSIGLTSNGSARIGMTLRGGIGPMHQGTVARIHRTRCRESPANTWCCSPAPGRLQKIPSGGVIGLENTYSAVNIDQLFDTFDPLTRLGLKGFIRGEAASLQGKGVEANQALKYLAPGLQSASQVTGELTRDEPVFDQLVVQGGRALQALASRSNELTQLIANTSTATGAIASQSAALEQALALLPGTLRRSTTTFAGLQKTLDALDPLVKVSKPAVRQLPQFLSSLNSLETVAIPTVGALYDLIHNPAGTGDLTELAQAAPGLERIAAQAFPEMVKQLNDSANQVAYLRNYTPDVAGALTNLGQAGAYYDANGHYIRTQPAVFAFGLTSSNQLTTQFPSQRYQGLQAARARCPGSAAQPAPDGLAPQAVPGCNTSDVPPGP